MVSCCAVLEVLLGMGCFPVVVLGPVVFLNVFLVVLFNLNLPPVDICFMATRH